MYTETEFDKLIKSVETEFSAHLAEVEKNFKLNGETTIESLAKAEEGEKKPEPKEDGKEEKKPEAKEAPAAEQKPAEGEAPAAEAPPAEGEAQPPAQEAAAPAQEAAAPAQAEGHDYDEEDLKHLQQMYMSMSKGELMAHHDACRAALDSKGMEKCGNEPAAAAPASAPIQKAEITSHDEANGGQISNAAVPHSVPGAKSPASKVEGVQMEKSENTAVELAKAETAAANAKAESLQKSLDLATQFLTKLVERKVAPQGKAITTLEVVAKSEGFTEEKSLSKSQIDSKLLVKAQDPSLAKSDRELINAYYLNGGGVTSISHLLK